MYHHHQIKMAQTITVRLQRSDKQPWGFRLQGGVDFCSPLILQRINGGSIADGAGLEPGDAVVKINNTEIYNLRHKEAQDVIVSAGNEFEITVARGAAWKPTVTPTGQLPKVEPCAQVNDVKPVTKTSLEATPQEFAQVGSRHNTSAKPFASVDQDGQIKSIVNKQYNTPVGMYSEESIAETLSSQAEVLAGGVLGVNFKKNERMYNCANSEVYKLLHEVENEPEPVESTVVYSPANVHHEPVTKHVATPVLKPVTPSNGLPTGQNVCYDCERLIVGVFVRIKDRNLHVECFKCATCGSSLKNQGYYNLNNKLYCDIHARLAALNSPPPGTVSNGMVPITNTKPAGGQRTGVAAISAALNAHANLNGAYKKEESILSPAHSRSSSTTSSSGYCNSNSLSPVQSNKVSPIHSRTNSATIMDESQQHVINKSDSFPHHYHQSHIFIDNNNKENIDEIDNGHNGFTNYKQPNAFIYKTMNGNIIRSVQPPGKGLDSKYKFPQPNIAPKPFGGAQVAFPPPELSFAPEVAAPAPVMAPPAAKAPAPAPSAPAEPPKMNGFKPGMATKLLDESVNKLNPNNDDFKKQASNVLKEMLEQRFKKQENGEIMGKKMLKNDHPMTKIIEICDNNITISPKSIPVPPPPPPSSLKTKANVIETKENAVENVRLRNKNMHNGKPFSNRKVSSELTSHARDRRSYIEKNNNEKSDDTDTATIAMRLDNGTHPVCNRGKHEIMSGPFITALGRIWCPEHFVCHNTNCKRALADIGFVEEKGDLYCEYCFEEFLAPMCTKCNSRIKGDCLNAIGKQFHPDCFKCTFCGKLFGNSPFFLEEGDPYCEADWNELFTTKCFACGFPVEAGDRWVEALSNNYHSQCFNCTMCKKNLEGQSFFAKGGRPFCKNHAR